jgi:flagellin-like hook-associated protein FlgL
LLAGGVGISLGTIQIQNGNLSASVDLSGAVTVGNVLAAIERAGVRVNATVDSAGRRLIIDSQTGDTPIIIVSERGTTSEDLGLFSPGLFETAEAVRQALLDNDPERASKLVANIDDSIARTIDARTRAGQQIVQLSFARTRLKGVMLSFEGLRSKTEEADLTEFATMLVNYQTIYEVSLATTVRVIQPTLFSFLR